MNLENLKISNHAKERYAERIMNINNKADILRYVQENDSKILNDIRKMVEFGVLIYSGSSTLVDDKRVVHVYLRDTWVIIVNPTDNKVITLYNIDLGLGREFNLEYINKMLEKLKNKDSALSKVKEDRDNQISEYSEIIKNNTIAIEESRKLIKSLEQQNECYSSIISNLDANVLLAEKEVRSVIASLIGKKVF